MKVSVASSPAASGTEMMCGFVFSDDCKPPTFDGIDDTKLISAITQSAKDMAGKQGRTVTIPISSSKKPARRVLLAGLGKKKDVTHDIMRHVAGVIAKKARDLKLGEYSIVLPAGTQIPPAILAPAAAEGSVMAMYAFDRFKCDDEDDNHDKNTAANASARPVSGQGLVADLLDAQNITSSRADPNLLFIIPDADSNSGIPDAVQTAVVIAQGNLLVRGVANLPPNECYPQTLADIARGIARRHKGRLKCKIIQKDELRRRGFGGITAVGQGSINDPKLIILEYSGSGPAKKGKGAATSGKGPIVLVGKAVTFDTGGISIKPGGGMDEMKFDKCGGCTVLGIMQTAARLQLDTDIVGIIPAVENMPGGASYRPGDIIRLYSGKTAEILNTDAEGRLILADALTYGEQEYAPREIIDFATLTGACIVALGTNVAGIISNDAALAGAMRESSERTAEPVWELPLDKQYMDMIKSSVADMKNMGTGRAAGTIVAAAFLKNAIMNDTPWVHFDIAGTAWTQTATRPRSYKSKGATGFGLRLVMDHLIAAKNN